MIDGKTQSKFNLHKLIICENLKSLFLAKTPYKRVGWDDFCWIIKL